MHDREVPPFLKLFRLGAWACTLLVVYLSLIPRAMEVRTGLPGGLEHAFAYACTAGAFGLGYRASPWWAIVAALGALSGLLEVLQGFVPGRHPGLDGAVASTAGALIGAGVAALLRRHVDA